MQPRAVIYCSKHGATKEYAQCLGKKKNLPVISIDHISGTLSKIFQCIFVVGFVTEKSWG